ncbi:GIY-YIG nuclease family protein [Jiangella aurantiaca]|uniref:GIY-YIG nuclease family protein n=1 Tax=Jiangella aurantiaca TaxID=2530373 RepID=A0A4V2YS09_9ACTN|nr:GIY-YIG nuclease family protein [Jiangella aurantiaca]TDD68447.1 GIY-YIG nuclease family protein [Jiangella aurantiaca]
MAGKQVRLFLVDGTPGGLMTAEIMNWTGHVLKGKREKLGEIRGRAEAKKVGVYILLGEDEATGGRRAYIGQSDDVANRLTHHDAKKDFWDEVVVITSKDNNLTTAHVRYLESRLIRLAKSIGRVPLSNGNEPSGGADLPEADASDMDYFIDQVRILLPVLGVDIFRGRDRQLTLRDTRDQKAIPKPDDGVVSPTFRFTNKAGVDANAQQIDGEFTVLAGSVIRAEMHKPARGSHSTLRHYVARSAVHEKVVADAVVNPGGTTVTLTRDYVFTSPSAAAAVVQGHGTANGRTAWVTEDGTRFGEWEDRGVE